MGRLLWTLRLFTIRHVVACPAAIPLLRNYQSRCACKFFTITAPCVQRLSHFGVAQSLKGIKGGFLGRVGPGFGLGSTYRQSQTLPRSTAISEVMVKEEGASGSFGNSPEALEDGQDLQGAGEDRLLQESRSNRLDLPRDDKDLPFSMQLLNSNFTLEGKGAGECRAARAFCPLFSVKEGKLELRSQIVQNIFQRIRALQDVTSVGDLLNKWLRGFVSRRDIMSTLETLSLHGDRQKNLSIARFVPYSQIARIIHAVMQELGREGRLDAALEVLRWMEGQGWCQLDPHLYTTIIAALGEAGNYELAEKIFGGLENTQVEKDPALLNAMLNARGKAGQLDSLEDLFESMKHSPHKPNLVTYNTVMNCYVKPGKGASYGGGCL